MHKYYKLTSKAQNFMENNHLNDFADEEIDSLQFLFGDICSYGFLKHTKVWTWCLHTREQVRNNTLKQRHILYSNKK